MWAFWVAAALAAIGAVAPLSFSIGAHSRLQWVIVPFGIAAVVLGINAVMYHQGRSLAAALYFFAGLAIVYGILAMVAVPLRLAVVGTCPPAPARCPLGYEQPLTRAGNAGSCRAGSGRAGSGCADSGRASPPPGSSGPGSSGPGSSGPGSSGRAYAGPGPGSTPRAEVPHPAPSQSQATCGRAQGAPCTRRTQRAAGTGRGRGTASTRLTAGLTLPGRHGFRFFRRAGDAPTLRARFARQGVSSEGRAQAHGRSGRIRSGVVVQDCRARLDRARHP